MKKPEVVNFLEKIKVYYPNFTINDMVRTEWINKLEPYDYEDCCIKLDEYLDSEYQKDPPKPNWIIKYLKTTEEKLNRPLFIVICPNCGKTMNYNNFDEHYKRCNSTDYMIHEMKKYLHKDVKRTQLECLDDKTFWDKYDTLLKIIEDKLPDGCGKKKFIQAYFGEIDMSAEETEKAIISGYEEV